jgi:hypothetical protein
MVALRWYVKFPLDAYALGPISFRTAVTEETVRAWARQFEGCKRLPRGFQCWPVGDRS